MSLIQQPLEENYQNRTPERSITEFTVINILDWQQIIMD